MDEREVRSDAGHDGDGTYRVDLTRHCLTSGIVQLPFALRDRIPEGDIVGADVDRDVDLDLRSEPPRHLAGLKSFFEAHELEVNDAIEFRLAGNAIRLAPVKRARKSDRERRGDGSHRSSWSAFLAEQEPVRTHRVRPDARATEPSPPDAHLSDAGEVRVVERIGSVTVRRLGKGDLPRPTPSEPAAYEPAAPEPIGSEPYAPEPSPPRAEPNPPGGDAAERDRTTTPDRADRVDAAGPEVAAEGVEAGAEAAAGDPAELVSGEAAPGRTPEPRAASVPSAPPSAPTSRRTRPRAYGVRPVRREDPVVTEEDLADPDDRRPRMVLGPPRPAHEVERDRQEQVSRSGDLRSRIVRWLLDPSTPVIVPFDRVEQTFELRPHVAAEVMQGILDEPPPSLRLTSLREGIVRVSRVTVDVED